MGKGDRKSKKGKITLGSYGVRRKKKKTKAFVAPEKPAKKEVAEKKPAAKKKTAAKKTAAKKAPAKKAAAKKSDDK